MELSIRRLLAYWIDFVLLASVLVGIQWLLSAVSSGFPFDYLHQGYEIELWVLLSMSLPVWLYFVLCEFYKQQTLGKRLFKLKVTDERGQSVRFSRILLRTFIKLLPWELTHLIILVPEPWWGTDTPQNLYLIYVPNLLLIIYVAILLINKGSKGIHDFVARTRVVQTKNRGTYGGK